MDHRFALHGSQMLLPLHVPYWLAHWECRRFFSLCNVLLVSRLGAAKEKDTMAMVKAFARLPQFEIMCYCSCNHMQSYF